MTPETKAELLRLVEAGDLTALALKVGERWLETCYPTSRFGTITADLGDGVPMVRIVILPASPAS